MQKANCLQGSYAPSKQLHELQLLVGWLWPLAPAIGLGEYADSPKPIEDLGKIISFLAVPLFLGALAGLALLIRMAIH